MYPDFYCRCLSLRMDTHFYIKNPNTPTKIQNIARKQLEISDYHFFIAMSHTWNEIHSREKKNAIHINYIFFISISDTANCNNIKCKDRQICLNDLITHRPRCVSCNFKCSRKRKPQVHFCFWFVNIFFVLLKLNFELEFVLFDISVINCIIYIRKFCLDNV